MQDRTHERVGAVLSHTSLCIGRAHDEVRSKRHGHGLKYQRLHTHSLTQDEWKEPSTMTTDFRVRRRERSQEMCHDVINTGLAHAPRTRAWSERGCADAPQASSSDFRRRGRRECYTATDRCKRRNHVHNIAMYESESKVRLRGEGESECMSRMKSLRVATVRVESVTRETVQNLSPCVHFKRGLETRGSMGSTRMLLDKRVFVLVLER